MAATPAAQTAACMQSPITYPRERGPSYVAWKLPDPQFRSKENKGFSAAFRPQAGLTKATWLPPTTDGLRTGGLGPKVSRVTLLRWEGLPVPAQRGQPLPAQ